jgi:hypothetical protein
MNRRNMIAALCGTAARLHGRSPRAGSLPFLLSGRSTAEARADK